MHKLAFLGLGVMGFPMAGHLAKAGHNVTVFNRNSDRAQKWCAEYTGRVAATPAEAAKGADFVMCCVGNDDDLREVTIGTNGAFSEIGKGSIFVDHTTVSARVTKELFDIGNNMEFDFIALQFLVDKPGRKMAYFRLCVVDLSKHLTKQSQF